MAKKDSLKRAKTAVIGIGRVGLPLAIFLADAGFTVYGIGKTSKKIEDLKKGKMPFMEEGAKKLLAKNVNKRFFPTTSYDCIASCKIIILTLGTPVDENMNPVLDQINEALSLMRPYIKKEQVLILRSTVSPGTTNYVKAWLDDLPEIKVGENFYLAFCPERIAEGRALEELRTIPQIVGGVDKKSTRKALDFFRELGIECLSSDDVSAELAKLFTNMYRYINFAIANEFMVIAGNFHRDIYQIVDLVNRNYKRGGLALPGMTGGPCLFKDGFFLISEFPFTELIATSWKINESIPLFLIEKIRERARLDGKKVAILGLAFKAEIDDIRESLSFKVRKAFLRQRANVIIHDPYVKEYPPQEVTTDVYEAVKGADVLFIATNHKMYRDLDLTKLRRLVSKNCIICDVWNVFGTNRIIFTMNSLDNHYHRLGKV